MVGKTIGKYRVVSRLGRGDMGTVYNGFIPLRVSESDLPRLIAELETRTGTKVVRAR